ncbi:hypothetical protein [Sphingomonas paeninsulae]|uniref:hypothetical protein n=1 Tax=Sphingomonas paeninsulae TaxID=2319844 RepID=UPI0013CEAE79|nr:hypothetical protein [Sphingomonas paeninsulae]
MGFDELAHASYVADLQAHHGPVRLEQLRMLDPKTFTFTSKPSYLNHADPYYRMLAVIGPRIEGHPEALIWHRAINVVVVTLGLALMLSAMISLARTVEERLIFAFGLACIPVLPQMAGSINNDNLAFLGGALLIFGVQRFLNRFRTADLLIAGFGVVIAAAAKLTGLMLAGGFLVAVMAIAWAHRLVNRRQIAIAIFSLLIAAIPAIGLWIGYGSPAPNTPAQAASLLDGARITGWADEPRLGAIAYVFEFLQSFVAGWMPMLDARSSWHSALLIIPLTAIGLAVAGTGYSAQSLFRGLGGRGPGDSTINYPAIVCAGALAITATMIIHIGFSYQRHLATGWLMDAFPRYYLPLIEIVPLAGVACFRGIERESLRKFVAGFLLMSPFIFRLLG